MKLKVLYESDVTVLTENKIISLIKSYFTKAMGTKPKADADKKIPIIIDQIKKYDDQIKKYENTPEHQDWKSWVLSFFGLNEDDIVGGILQQLSIIGAVATPLLSLAAMVFIAPGAAAPAAALSGVLSGLLLIIGRATQDVPV